MGFRSNGYNTEKIAAALKVDESKLKAAMKANQVGGFARVWSVEDKGNYSVVKISTSKKRKDGDSYETDFQTNFVRFVGDAHKLLSSIDVTEKGVSIQITNCEATTPYNAETKKSYNNYVVYAFDLPEGNASSSGSKKATSAKSAKNKRNNEVEEDEDSSDLPF